MFLQDVTRICRDIAREGWAEANAGNLSLRLREEELGDRSTLSFDGAWRELAAPVPSLGGEYFLMTAGGSRIDRVPDVPQRHCGVIQLDDAGTRYRVIWGLEGTRPTSEILAHLMSHAVRKARTGGADRVILHTHPLNLIALCHVREWDTRSLTRLLWSMHSEGVCLFPDGIFYLPFAIPGSRDISEKTCRAFENHAMVLWEYHGVFASGDSLDHAFGMVQAAEKAAGIYRAACEMGGAARVLDDKTIRAVAASLGLTPAPGILEE